jgi:citrate lyase subunit beta/citryl-CoA lyase
MSQYSPSEVGAARSLLFVPGDRPERFPKAFAARPDIVIIDLEDAVAPTNKDAARAHARAWLGGGNRAMLRINGYGTDWHTNDLELVAEFDAPIMLPKAETPGAIETVCAQRDGRATVVPLVETAAGLFAAAVLGAAPCVVRLAFGSIDFATQLGVAPDDRDALLFARSMLVTASFAAGCHPPIDGVTTAIDPPLPVTGDFNYARRLGMTAKLCIHPKQVDLVHAAAAPSATALAWARRVLAVAQTGESAIAVDGQMVDKPVLERARRIVADSALGQPMHV